MRKKLTFATAFIILAVFLLPVSPYGNKGYYNFATNTLYCNSARGCRHEIGHRMDAEAGHPGRSSEFSHSIQLYLYVELHKEPVSDFAMAVLTFPPMMSHRAPRFPISSSGQEELYADMYAWVDGDIEEIPEIFRTFYSRDEKYKDTYNCLMQNRVSLCGAALHIEKR